MIALEESDFRFELGDSWRYVERWDRRPEFIKGIQRVNGTLDGRTEGTKAVDFVGVRAGDVWLFEVKDFRNRTPDWEKRFREIPLEISLKVRDTIAGILGSHHRNAAAAWAHDAVEKLATLTPMTIVVIIARPAHWRREPTAQLKMQNNVLMKEIKRMLAWLTRRVYVIDPMSTSDVGALPEVVVSSLTQRKPNTGRTR